MFASVIIPTIDRSSLARSVDSVLGQDFTADEFEVIVVNDTGRTLTPAAWQASPRVRILDSQKRNRCFARNAGAAVAKGRYLVFLDDDDWLLPVAFSTLWTVAQQNPSAGWIYGGVRFFDEHEHFLTEHHVGISGNGFVQLMGGDWIALTGSIIKSELFFEVGGFDPRFKAANIHEMNRKLAFRTELATSTQAVACVLRDRKSTTTDYGIFERLNVMSRDIVLSQKGAFSRMRRSATDAYWAGKVVRAYLTCVHFNMKERQFSVAFSRGWSALAGLLLAGPRVFQPTFWRAIRHFHSRANIY